FVPPRLVRVIVRLRRTDVARSPIPVVPRGDVLVHPKLLLQEPPFVLSLRESSLPSTVEEHKDRRRRRDRRDGDRDDAEPFGGGGFPHLGSRYSGAGFLN